MLQHVAFNVVKLGLIGVCRASGSSIFGTSTPSAAGMEICDLEALFVSIVWWFHSHPSCKLLLLHRVALSKSTLATGGCHRNLASTTAWVHAKQAPLWICRNEAINAAGGRPAGADDIPAQQLPQRLPACHPCTAAESCLRHHPTRQVNSLTSAIA